MAQVSSIPVLPPGTKLRSKDRVYEIVEVLGSGSFGITYKAIAKVSIENISTTLKFAIKEHFLSASCYRGEDGVTVLSLPQAKSDVVESRSDFITEANRLRQLCRKSRNIVSVNETFEANGTAYYVMDYLDGGSLAQCSEDEAISIVGQIANALSEIHKEKLLHLDIKPANIVLKKDDYGKTYPVLIDFGISKHFDSKNKPTSKLGAKGASPGYAPQEQYADVTEFSPKYDIYALGAVLYYLCTGKNPPDAFKISPNQQELKVRLRGKVSSKVETAILNAMKPSAMERTPNIQQFCEELPNRNNIVPNRSKTTSLDQNTVGTVILPRHFMWWTQYRRKVFQLIGGIIAVSCVVGLYVAFRPNPDKESNRLITANTSMNGPESEEQEQQANEQVSGQDDVAHQSKNEPMAAGHSESLPEKVEEVKLPIKTDSKLPTDEELFARASKIEDFQKLAAKGYKKAYAPLAERYLQKNDYDNAHIWAVKAGGANIGLDKACKVIRVLSNNGYYHNGEHGGEPEFYKRYVKTEGAE